MARELMPVINMPPLKAVPTVLPSGSCSKYEVLISVKDKGSSVLGC
jgi:hypothetical protein